MQRNAKYEGMRGIAVRMQRLSRVMARQVAVIEKSLYSQQVVDRIDAADIHECVSPAHP